MGGEDNEGCLLYDEVWSSIVKANSNTGLCWTVYWLAFISYNLVVAIISTVVQGNFKRKSFKY